MSQSNGLPVSTVDINYLTPKLHSLCTVGFRMIKVNSLYTMNQEIRLEIKLQYYILYSILRLYHEVVFNVSLAAIMLQVSLDKSLSCYNTRFMRKYNNQGLRGSVQIFDRLVTIKICVSTGGVLKLIQKKSNNLIYIITFVSVLSKLK